MVVTGCLVPRPRIDLGGQDGCMVPNAVRRSVESPVIRLNLVNDLHPLHLRGSS
jgi:hypothetical protein